MKTNLTAISGWIVLAAGLLCLYVWEIDSFMLPSCDEVYYSSTAYTLLTTGQFGFPLVNNLVGIGESYIPLGRLLVLGQAVFQFLLGPTILAARLYSLLGLMLLLIVAYHLSVLLFPVGSQLAAGWTALLIAVDWSIFTQTRSGRPDIWSTAVIYSVLYLILSINENTPIWRLVFTGFLAVAQLDIHLIGINFVLPFLTLAIYQTHFSHKLRSALVPLALGGLVGGAYYLVAHLYPDPLLAINQYEVFLEPIYAQDISIVRKFANFGQWWINSYLLSFSRLSSLLMMCIFVLMTLAFTDARNRYGFLVIGIFILVSWIMFATLNAIKPEYYAVIWRPGLYLLAAPGLMYYMKPASRSSLGQLIPGNFIKPFLLMPIILVLSLIAGDIYLVAKFKNADYDQYVSKLRELIPESGQVLADELWWYGLSDYKYVSSLYPFWAGWTDRTANRNNYQVASESLQNLEPDYVIFDKSIGCTDTSPAETALIRQYVSDNCRYLGTVEGAWFSSSEIHSCNTATR